MTTPDRVAVGIDATPLVTGHAIRGIGRYLAGVLAAVAAVEPAWTRENLGLLLLRGQAAPIDAAVWRTWRSPVRPQDLDPLVAPVADRAAVRGRRPLVWHHTDSGVPFAPLSSGSTIVTVYDLIPLLDHAVMAGIRRHRRLVYKRYLGQIRAARGVVTISRSTAEDVVRLLGVPTDRIRVIQPFVQTGDPAGRFGSREGLGSTHRSPARPTFLIVGVPGPHKRVELALEAFGALIRRGVDAQLVFAGVHPPAGRARLRELVGRSGIDDRVRFAGHVDDAELRRLYADSILLATSSIEGFGLPPVEAIVAGGAVVATPTAAYLDALGDTATYAADASSAALAEAMESALGRAPDAAAPGRLAARFGPDPVAHALIGAYRELGGVG